MISLPVRGFSDRANIHAPRMMLALFCFVPGARDALTPARQHASTLRGLMRKGRSQRKTRGSLPPTSKRPQSRLGAPSSAGPQVVVGHAAPRAEEYVDGASRHPETLADVRETRSDCERYEAPAPVAQLELVREHGPEPEPAHDEVGTPPDGGTKDEAPEPTARVETLTFAVAETPSDDFDDARDDASHDAPDDARAVNAQAATAVKPESRGSHVTSLPTPEEMSIPPMGDLSVEPIADRFFSEGELVAARTDHEAEEWDERASKAVLKSLPEVVQRRARFAKYVRWAVGGAAVLCLAAVARSALPPSGSPGAASTSLSQSARLEAPASKAASVAIIATAEPVSAPVVAVPVAIAPAAAEPAKAVEPAAAAPAVAAAPADAPPAADGVPTSDKTALQEKNDSRRALERGKLTDAIAAGERSVALDPTDGEAWLLLGAAYQEKGKNADARRCYSSCVKEGKRGPLGECRALVH